jgi:predicted ester cyclase
MSVVDESRRVVAEFGQRLAAGDLSAFDDLVAEDFVNHAAAPQGRDGLRTTYAVLRHDLGDFTAEEHQVLADGDRVVVHMTLQSRHVASTMPLLSGVPVTNAPVAWEFIHIWRVRDGRLAEHWACRDDLGLLRQLGAWSPD